jgi:predicted aldo/keto reductase-like oxidoreductase
MKVSEQELEKMYHWITHAMKTDTWYPVKSDKAFEVIKQLFDEGLIDFCEFNENETHIRKVDTELLD